MKTIGVTGGIGSGKSIVCRVFQSLGIPVFNADEEARAIYDTEQTVLMEVKQAFGEHVFMENMLNKVALAKIVFEDPEALNRLNNIVHPKVRQRFAMWKEAQNAPYIIREAAILIESGAYKDCDKIILVSANAAIRTERVIARSGLSEDDIRKRIANQMSDDERRAFCQYEIVNDEDCAILPQIMVIHNSIMEPRE
jgi:dephospho-CoA kinase